MTIGHLLPRIAEEEGIDACPVPGYSRGLRQSHLRNGIYFASKVTPFLRWPDCIKSSLIPQLASQYCAL